MEVISIQKLKQWMTMAHHVKQTIGDLGTGATVKVAPYKCQHCFEDATEFLKKRPL